MSKANEALDRMAENARELGLDYEPDGMHHNKPQKRPQNCGTGYCSCIECVMEPAQQEPVAWIVEFENGEQELHFEAQSVGEKNTPLYTSPQAQRTWVGLTDEEIDDIYQGVGRNDLMLVREAEAELRKKNHA